MSFREKSAWISFMSLLAVGAVWMARVSGVAGGSRGNPMIEFLALLVVLVVLEIGLHVAIAIQSPRDARTPRDERERLIDLKASRVAFYVLMAGAWASIGTLHLGASRFGVAHAVMGAILVSLLVRFATQIVLYRRDA